MTYTVKKLANLSGVSVRTLRFYDEIGLLKPAYYGVNNYRYYEEEQLLMLQQILFFRELGFQLNDIQKIISSSDFDKIEALNSHKQYLEKNISQTKKMLDTIDKTIAHLKGKTKMQDIEMFESIRPRDSEKQKGYEEYLIENKLMTKEELDKSWKGVKSWKKSDWDKYIQQGHDLNEKLANAIRDNYQPDSPEVQKLINDHYAMIKIFWQPNKESYIGLANLYAEHEDFRQFYDRYHPELIAFLKEAMKIFAERNLS